MVPVPIIRRLATRKHVLGDEEEEQEGESEKPQPQPPTNKPEARMQLKTQASKAQITMAKLAPPVTHQTFMERVLQRTKQALGIIVMNPDGQENGRQLVPCLQTTVRACARTASSSAHDKSQRRSWATRIQVC